MSGSAGPCSLELLSWGYRAVKAGSTDIGVAVDSTLSDHGSHGERAHSRPSGRLPGWPVGAGNPVTSRDLGVFVDQTAEPVPAEDRDIRAQGGRVLAPNRRTLVKASGAGRWVL
jgi:hypothetical protein